MPLCVGWKSICKLLDCKDPKTARKWVKRCHLPVIWISGRPAISVAQFDDWWSQMEKKLAPEKDSAKYLHFG
jgi:hypothetical protein